MLYSTDLVNWRAVAAPISGTNGPLQIPVTISEAPEAFFRVRASY